MDIKHIHAGGYSARINLDRGANCISLRHNATSAVILREPPESYELDNPFLYGMPILFPVNRISGAEFEFEGRTYRFPLNEEATGCHLHGMMHGMPFKLLSCDESSLAASYRAECGEYIGFPHSFEILIEYKLSDEGLDKRVTVTNLSDENMPCLIGFHTTFNARPFGNDVETRVLVDIDKEYERNMTNYLPTGRCPAPDRITEALKSGSLDPLSEPISRHYLAGGDMRLEISSGELTVSYENSKNMPFRLIYNGDASGFICLEPQTSLANSPNSKFTREAAGFSYIEPHKQKIFTSRISIKSKEK